MDLWIKTQNKERITKIYDVYIEETIIDKNESEWWFYGINVDGCDIRLGIYKSKERALEVLDEIQNFIENDCQEYITMQDNEEIYQTSRNVYEMPKE